MSVYKVSFNTEKLRIGMYVLTRYRGHGEPDKDYLHKIVGFDPHFGKEGADAIVVAVRENGVWKPYLDTTRRFRLWDFNFKIGHAIPESGTGRATIYIGKLPDFLRGGK